MSFNATSTKFASKSVYAIAYLLISVVVIMAIGYAVYIHQRAGNQSICSFTPIQISPRFVKRCFLLSEIDDYSPLIFAGSIIFLPTSALFNILYFIVLFHRKKLFEEVVDVGKVGAFQSIVSLLFCCLVFYVIFMMDTQIDVLSKYRLFMAFPGSLVFNSMASLVFSVTACSPILMILKELYGGDDVR